MTRRHWDARRRTRRYGAVFSSCALRAYACSSDKFGRLTDKSLLQFKAGVGSGRTLQAPAPQGPAPSLALTLVSGLRLGPPFPLPIRLLAVCPMGILLLLLLLLLRSGVTLIPLLKLTVLGG